MLPIARQANDLVRGVGVKLTVEDVSQFVGWSAREARHCR
jgi:hypothetical protein